MAIYIAVASTANLYSSINIAVYADEAKCITWRRRMYMQ